MMQSGSWRSKRPANAALLPLAELFGVQGQPVILFGDLEQPVLGLPEGEGFRLRPGFLGALTPVIWIVDKIFHVHLNELLCSST